MPIPEPPETGNQLSWVLYVILTLAVLGAVAVAKYLRDDKAEQNKKAEERELRYREDLREERAYHQSSSAANMDIIMTHCKEELREIGTAMTQAMTVAIREIVSELRKGG